MANIATASWKVKKATASQGKGVGDQVEKDKYR